MKIIERVSNWICGVKINYHLIIPLSLKELSALNRFSSSLDLLTIADIKLNDIANTNRVASGYLWDAGFSGVIVNPFVGLKGGLDVVFEDAKALGKGVITLAYMSHPGADEGYGIELKDGELLSDLFIQKANFWGADGVILGSTRPERIRISRQSLGREIKILCPGSGAQGGDPLKALESGADYLIFGRYIVDSPNQVEAVKQVYQKLLAFEARN